jgi:hypothetical protein
MRCTIVAALFSATLLAAGVATYVHATTPSTTINACVHQGNDQLRIVPSGDSCANNETPLTWSITGPTGPVGPAGPIGPTGPTGPTGAIGATGPSGPAGSVGPAGAVGQAGPPGSVGPQGSQGATGAAGSNGAQGQAGPPGPAGSVGLVGVFNYCNHDFQCFVACPPGYMAMGGGGGPVQGTPSSPPTLASGGTSVLPNGNGYSPPIGQSLLYPNGWYIQFSVNANVDMYVEVSCAQLSSS